MTRPGNPFSPRTALALVVFGAVVFVALLWMIGAGWTGGDTNDAGGHVDGRGLNGYAAMARYLDARGFEVRRVRSPSALKDPHLLILTPPQGGPADEIEKIVSARRRIGPTIVIDPKWLAAPVDLKQAPTAKKGWVAIGGVQLPNWPGFRDDVSVDQKPMSGGWRGMGLGGTLPEAKAVEFGGGKFVVPLVTGGDGRILTGFIGDDGDYPALQRWGPEDYTGGDNDALYPLVFVFEPDLLDNYGMAKPENALLAERLVSAASAGDKTVAFDLTLNGFARSANLLTLAFTRPFLAATICLLLAALAVGWRAFNRFGPPRLPERSVAFGKRALVANTAGLIRRAKRLHLVGAPYADAARERLARDLALPRGLDPAATEAAIDRALAARNPEAALFSHAAQTLRQSRRPQDMLRAARSLYALERMLTR